MHATQSPIPIIHDHNPYIYIYIIYIKCGTELYMLYCFCAVYRQYILHGLLYIIYYYDIIIIIGMHVFIAEYIIVVIHMTANTLHNSNKLTKLASIIIIIIDRVHYLLSSAPSLQCGFVAYHYTQL